MNERPSPCNCNPARRPVGKGVIHKRHVRLTNWELALSIRTRCRAHHRENFASDKFSPLRLTHSAINTSPTQHLVNGAHAKGKHTEEASIKRKRRLTDPLKFYWGMPMLMSFRLELVIKPFNLHRSMHKRNKNKPDLWSISIYQLCLVRTQML